jgi:tripartite-type tricarboxylate transporter receptor subunit TctC
MNIFGSTPDELDTHLRSEIARWGKAVREANIKIH